MKKLTKEEAIQLLETQGQNLSNLSLKLGYLRETSSNFVAEKIYTEEYKGMAFRIVRDKGLFKTNYVIEIGEDLLGGYLTSHSLYLTFKGGFAAIQLNSCEVVSLSLGSVETLTEINNLLEFWKKNHQRISTAYFCGTDLDVFETNKILTFGRNFGTILEMSPDEGETKVIEDRHIKAAYLSKTSSVVLETVFGLIILDLNSREDWTKLGKSSSFFGEIPAMTFDIFEDRAISLLKRWRKVAGGTMTHEQAIIGFLTEAGDGFSLPNHRVDVIETK